MVAKPVTIFLSLSPSYQYTQNFVTKVGFFMVIFALNSLNIEFNAFSHLLFKGPKQVTSNGWRTCATCVGNFIMKTFSFIAFSITARDTWVRWPSKINKSGLCVVISQNFANHKAKISVVIHPLSESPQKIFFSGGFYGLREVCQFFP